MASLQVEIESFSNGDNNGLSVFKDKLLILSNNYDYSVILDSNQYTHIPHQEYELLAGFGAKSILTSNNFSDLETLHKKKSWLFGFLSYDLKNQLEDLKSENFDELEFPELCFFEPEVLVKIKDGICTIEGDGSVAFLSELRNVEIEFSLTLAPINIRSRISKEKYIKQVLQLLNHIQLGDIFEVNFCQEYFAEKVELDPVSVYHSLKKISKTPFASYLKFGDKYCLCASPERFIKKKSTEVISQPIKGTIKRGFSEQLDEELKTALLNNKKEIAENIMIVDLVRNDFSKIAAKGSVEVEELLGIYTFPQVHQMISTVKCEVEVELSSIDIIKSCFPMGSMTGAPKVRAMKLIEQYESTKRSLYSGAIGYIDPVGDFDFNVVIRSLLYNSTNNYLSFSVGGAITHGSTPELEYQESQLKAKAIFEVLSNKVC